MADTVTINVTETAQTVTINVSQYNVPASTAVSDFLIGNATGWLKKTLAEVKVILGLGSTAYTDTTDYQPVQTAFQTATYANPETLIDMSVYKDWILTITGATVINFENVSDGDAGMLSARITGAGGYVINLEAGTLTKQLGSTDIVATTGTDNVISWRKAGADIYYTIQQVE